MNMKKIKVGFFLLVSSFLFSFNSNDVTFYLTFDNGLKAEVCGGNPEPLRGIIPKFEEGIKGKAVRVGKSVWGEMKEIPVVKMPVDIGLWRDYGKEDSVGPLRYYAKGNIRDKEGTISFWYKPLGWEMTNGRDHFMVNLGMKDTLALIYATYFSCISFQNSVGPYRYKRCIAGWPKEYRGSTKNRWVNITASWRDDFMALYLDGKKLAEVKEDVIPLRNPEGEILLGSGDYEECAFDDVIILSKAVGDVEAKALYERNIKRNGKNFITVPPVIAPVIDGKIEKNEWEGAMELKGWTDKILGVANGDKTEIKIGYDEKNLYVSFIYPIPEDFKREKTKYVGCPLKITENNMDGNIFKDDYVGIYISPPDSEGIYFFGTNGGNVKRDEKNGDINWNGNWDVKQLWDDNYWTVEFAIPFNNFKSGPSGIWRINFVHGAKQIENLDSIWSFEPAELIPMSEMKFWEEEKIVSKIRNIGELSEGQFLLEVEILNKGENVPKAIVEVSIRKVEEIPEKTKSLRDGTIEVLPKKEEIVVFKDKKEITLEPGRLEKIVSKTSITEPIYGKVFIEIKNEKGITLLNYILPFVYSKEISIEARYIPTPEILHLVMDLGSTSTLQETSGCKIKILSEKGEVVKEEEIKDFKKVRDAIDINCKALPVGKYKVLVEFKSGKSTISVSDKFEKENPPVWLNNKIGYFDKVPAPWTPMKVKGKKVYCWAKEIEFNGAAGLPSSIKILGEEILSEPVKISIKEDENEGEAKNSRFQLEKKEETRITFSTKSKFGNLKIESTNWIEFDGFVWNTIKILPERETTIKNLSIEFPLKREYATLWWPAEYIPNPKGAGKTPSELYVSNPINWMRIGDEEHGLQFCFETFKNWNYEEGKGQELIPLKDKYIVKFNIINIPTKINTPFEISFGYTLLPARPRSYYYRLIDVNQMWTGSTKWVGGEPYDKNITPSSLYEKYHKLFMVHPLYTWLTWSGHWNYFNYWNEKVYDEDFKERVRDKYRKNWETGRNTLAMYLNDTLVDANTPEYRQYRFEWQTIPGSAPYVPEDPKTRDRNDIPGSVCVGCNSYADFHIWMLDKAVKYLSDNGERPIHCYLDNTCVFFCKNTFHGCPEDGNVPILKWRELMKRRYYVYKSLNPQNQIYIHCSGCVKMAGHVFSDVLIQGENFTAWYNSQLANNPSLPKNYTKFLTLDKFRAQYMSYTFGPDQFLLYQFYGSWDKTEPDKAEKARAHLWGLALVHDVGVWTAGTPLNIVKAINELGWDDKVEFVPYWRKNTGIGVKSDTEPVVVSGWKRGDGNLLVMVFNDSDKTANVSLTVDFKKFGFNGNSVNYRDYGCGGLAYPESFKEQEVKEGKTNGEIKFELGQHSYKLLRFFK